MEIFIIYPHQLFEDINPLIGKKIILVEEPLFFTQYKFHVQKLIYHRATMKFYENYLQKKGFELEYFEDEDYLQKYKHSKVFIYDVVDFNLHKKIIKNFKDISIYLNPNFLNVKDNNKLLHNFYINRRKELNLFVDNGKPYGGRWSFDNENRKKLPKNIELPIQTTYKNRYIDEAKIYVDRFDTIGEVKEFYYPITFEEVKKHFDDFLIYKFDKFGSYQDAIFDKDSFLFHSNISASLNCGTLCLNHILNKIVDSEVIFNSKEGFLRQIIGWREFFLNIYKSDGVRLRNSNFFNFSKKIPKKIIEAKSGIKPLDDAIIKLNKNCYLHHIERLMVIGNLFLLLEIAPDEIYKFFMVNFIDAYDWVMVGNVYGMSGFSDGGSITTKPYISSSNYILKMSNYKKDKWCEIWDGLYWRFIYKYSALFKSNPRMQMQIRILGKMDKDKLDTHLKNAQEYMINIYD